MSPPEPPPEPAQAHDPDRRRRRLTLIAALTPGVLLATWGVEACQSPALLATGVALIVLALLARRLGPLRFRTCSPSSSEPFE